MFESMAQQGVLGKCIHSVVCCMLYCPQKLNGEEEVSCIEEQFHSKRNAFAALCKENMESEQNVEDYKRNISERYVVKAGRWRNMQHLLCDITTAEGHVFVHHYFTGGLFSVRKQWSSCARRGSRCSRKPFTMMSGGRRPRRRWPKWSPGTVSPRLSWTSRSSSPSWRNTGPGSVTTCRHVLCSRHESPFVWKCEILTASSSVTLWPLCAPQTEIENLKEDLTGRITVLELLQVNSAASHPSPRGKKSKQSRS